MRRSNVYTNLPSPSNISPRRVAPGKILGTRELILSPLPYLIVYSVEEERIHVLRIFHGAQNWS
ncbi:type II toxin-antitoxin system RelE/ParE family toxin [Acidicapsa acidisoli]|uniref:type II toxin-antitoxin system RelE/ParE family toxin n=1 Tax=Acidicapsa acidisoli TaxID=1615681 RepID=UPI0037BE93CE